MSIVLNQPALEYARRLLDDEQYAINTVWEHNAPTEEQSSAYKAMHGEAAFKLWYLAIERDANGNAIYMLPYGDFRKLHRSGVVAAYKRAIQLNAADVAAGARELLDLLDRMNAC
ncbi:MAG: hypothetical protein SNJ59_16250 [Aggregatilineales bacterium]